MPVGFQVLDLNHILALEKPCCRILWSGLWRSRPLFDCSVRHAVQSNDPVPASLIKVHDTEGCFAQTHRAVEHDIQYRLEVAWRGVDDFQDLRGGGLMFQRLA